MFQRLYIWVKALVISAVAFTAILPLSLYIALSTPYIQNSARIASQKQLSALLGVDVTIGSLNIRPFDQVQLRDVMLHQEAASDTIATIESLSAGIDLYKLIRYQNITVTYVEINELNLRVWRNDKTSPTNLQPIINALSPKDPSKPPAHFNMAIDLVILRECTASYDIKSQPQQDVTFNPSHIKVCDINGLIRLPALGTDSTIIILQQLSAATPHYGPSITSAKAKAIISNNNLTIQGLRLSTENESEIKLSDLSIPINKPQHLLKTTPIEAALLPGTRFTSKDIAYFVPQLGKLDLEFDTDIKLNGTLHNMHIPYVHIASQPFNLNATDIKLCNIDDPSTLSVKIDNAEIEINAFFITPRIHSFVTKIDPTVIKSIEAFGKTKINANISYSATEITSTTSIKSQIAEAFADFTILLPSKPSPNTNIRGILNIDFPKISDITSILAPSIALTELSANTEFDISIDKSLMPEGDLSATITRITYANNNFTDVLLNASAHKGNYDLSLSITNPGVMADLEAYIQTATPQKQLDLNMSARNIDLSMFTRESSPRLFSVNCNAQISGCDTDHITGYANLSDIRIDDSHQHTLMSIDRADIEASADSTGQSYLTLTSDIADACITGHYIPSALPTVALGMLHNILPALTPHYAPDQELQDAQIYCNATLKCTKPLAPLIKLPIQIIHPVTLTGKLNSANGIMDLTLDAPYIQQGNKIIENTLLTAHVAGAQTSGDGVAHLTLSTILPTANGPLTLNATSNAIRNNIDTNISWKILREHNYSGNLNLSTHVARDSADMLEARIDINPGEVTFNDTTWNVKPSDIIISSGRGYINGFWAGRPGQHIAIDGKISDSPSDSLTLQLNNIDLDYIFQTLAIPTAQFGGVATGNFYAFGLLSPTPHAFTPELYVQDLTYNRCLMGNTHITSNWNPTRRAVELEADIKQRNGHRSRVSGAIMPMADSLDLHFDADHVPIGFLQHYMSAFATNVEGTASGKARLWGSFKLIDMVGDIAANDIALTIGFTGTTYHASDSVHFSPGRIDIPTLKLHDDLGNKALLQGWLTHKCFKAPEFCFKLHNAERLLIYDIAENSSQRWFGKVFGNGTAQINGRPGFVDIDIDMTTTLGSAFSFVLSDDMVASNYDFISFRDPDKPYRDSLAAISEAPKEIIDLKKRLKKTQSQDKPSEYNIDIDIDVTPQAQINLVMDPKSGDRIRSWGAGNIRLLYGSANEDLRLNGTYTVERGKYNFTLQNIIIKDFTLRSGSSITFHGDPYAAQLDIAATYGVNANLSDLDESFLNDKELNRTNVPVNALLLVTGDLRQPDINFDMELPTLTSDTYRKVRSIISTEDMMSRQIIYLLALNRFYTPDYMSATKGNELVSVASSTISSQLSNMLGQLSDNWSLSPTFRSDKGDFSDLEVDIALSSHLLNNRLLLNGNLGYRDKNLNNNSFIGDFDIEYLLNRSGTLRLKAYNHYNDQNYYIKPALTTQGVGIMVKRDFDNALSFIRPWLKTITKTKTKHNTPPDSTSAAMTDTLR